MNPQRLPGGHQQLPLHQVQPGDQLGDRVLDLQPGVHLQEEELIGCLRRHQELDRPHTGVPHGLRDGHRALPHPGPGRGVQQHRRRLFNDLLMPPLQAALPLSEVHHRAVRISQHLDLDMPRSGQVPFDEQGVVTESSQGLPAGASDGLGQVPRAVHHPQALAPATSGGLDQHRVADRGGCLGQRVVTTRTATTRQHRNARSRHGRPGADLVAHRLDRASRRADKDQTGAGAGRGEGGVL